MALVEQLNDLVLQIIVSLAKNDKFTDSNIELLEPTLYDLCEELLTKASNYEFQDIEQVKLEISVVRNKCSFQMRARCGDKKISVRAVQKVLTQLDVELDAALLCFDCVYNQVMFEDGHLHVCSKPHQLVWFATSYVRDQSINLPAKVIAVDDLKKLVWIRTFGDKVGEVRRITLVNSLDQFLYLTRAYEWDVPPGLDSLLYLAMEQVRGHVRRLRDKYGKTKLIFAKEITRWHGQDLFLPNVQVNPC